MIAPEVTMGVGQYVASETHIGIHGRLYKPTQPGVVFIQGSHSLAISLTFPRTDGFPPTAYRFAEAGFCVAAGDLSQTLTQGTFGNDTAVTRVGQILAYAQSTLGMKAGKVHLFAGSGGCTAALNYARLNPNNVRSMALLDPLTDLQDFYENRLPNSGLTQAEVDAAYGGSVAAHYSTNSPIAIADKTPLAGIPMQLYYSTNDPFIPVATVTAYQAAINTIGGNCQIVSLGAVGHSDNGYDSINYAAFFQAH